MPAASSEKFSFCNSSNIHYGKGRGNHRSGLNPGRETCGSEFTVCIWKSGLLSGSEIEFDYSRSTKMYTLTELEKCIRILNDRNFEGKFAVKAVI